MTNGDQAQDLAIVGHKILTAGFTASEGASVNDWLLLRVREGGTLDTSFAGDGAKVTDFGTLNDFANGLAVAGGRIVVTGYTEDDVAVASYRG